MVVSKIIIRALYVEDGSIRENQHDGVVEGPNETLLALKIDKGAMNIGM